MDAGISVWTQSKVLESNVTFVVKFIRQSGMTMNQLRQKLLHRVELSNSKVCQFEVFCAGFFASFPALSNSWTMKMWLYFIFHKCLFIRRIIMTLIYDLITISLTFWALWYWPEMKKITFWRIFDPVEQWIHTKTFKRIFGWQNTTIIFVYNLDVYQIIIIIM